MPKGSRGILVLTDKLPSYDFSMLQSSLPLTSTFDRCIATASMCELQKGQISPLIQRIKQETLALAKQ